ncbi:MAG: ABC transporter substrate-binding protein [Clostridia bacterium]|nr:ABC transporter substrate-binding protein [Clostridia bacterium]
MKKILSLCLVLLLACSFAACSSTPHVGIDSSALDPFVIGGIGPLTEDRGDYGRSVYQGAQIAVEEINATGGVNGFRLVLNFQDSKGDPQTAVTLYEKLLDNDMKVLLGGVFSDETDALIPIAAQDGLLMVSPTSSRSDALGTTGNGFRICFSDVRLGTIAANFIADNRLTTNVSVIWSDDVFGGKEQAEAFQSAFESRGGTVESYEIPKEEPVNAATDYSSVIDRLQNDPPEMIYLALSPAESKAFLKAYEWDGALSPVKIIGSSGLEGMLESAEAPTMLEGTFVVTSFASDEDSTLVQSFVSAYREAYGTTPDRYAADGYDAVYAIAEGLRKAGITPENVDNDDFNRKMVSAMTKITVNGITGTMSWTTDGETTRPASVKVIQSGRYTTFVKAQ